MRRQLAEGYARKLLEMPIVESAEVSQGERGIFVECTVTDNVAKYHLEEEVVPDYPVWVEVESAI